MCLPVRVLSPASRFPSNPEAWWSPRIFTLLVWMGRLSFPRRYSIRHAPSRSYDSRPGRHSDTSNLCFTKSRAAWRTLLGGFWSKLLSRLPSRNRSRMSISDKASNSFTLLKIAREKERREKRGNDTTFRPSVVRCQSWYPARKNPIVKSK